MKICQQSNSKRKKFNQTYPLESIYNSQTTKEGGIQNENYNKEDNMNNIIVTRIVILKKEVCPVKKIK